MVEHHYLMPMARPKSSSAPSHVLYRLMILCFYGKRTSKNIKNLKLLFQFYGDAFRQRVSQDKCQFFVVSMSKEKVLTILQQFSCKEFVAADGLIQHSSFQNLFLLCLLSFCTFYFHYLSSGNILKFVITSFRYFVRAIYK